MYEQAQMAREKSYAASSGNFADRIGAAAQMVQPPPSPLATRSATELEILHRRLEASLMQLTELMMGMTNHADTLFGPVPAEDGKANGLIGKPQGMIGELLMTADALQRTIEVVCGQAARYRQL